MPSYFGRKIQLGVPNRSLHSGKLRALASLALFVAASGGVMIETYAQRGKRFEGRCDTSLIDRGIPFWSSDQYIFDCTASPSHNFDIVIPPQTGAYLIDISWGGTDMAGGHPSGSVTLTTESDEKRTNALRAPDPGDNESTWRWRGNVNNVEVESGEAKQISVIHDTRFSKARNTYLRIKFRGNI